MNAVERYVDDLRAALGTRLPRDLTQARLREARSHLLASAAELGGAEAVRRYGRPRAVANSLVRSHRGYGERSAWRLALPLGLAWAAGGVASVLIVLSHGNDATSIRLLGLLNSLSPLLALAFLLRAAQTRRWIAAPIMAWQVAYAAVVSAVASTRMSVVFGPSPATGLIMFVLRALALNALALGIGRLLDLRPVRRAR